MSKFSLEHIIRNIASGNFTPSDEPKITLEHAIKKVVRRESSFAAKDSKPVDEDVGGLVGSGTGGEGKLHSEDGKKKKQQMPDEEDDKLAGNEDKMDEAVGSIGTDKFQGSQFKSVRSSTPHIKPPGPEHGHSQAPENVSRQRSIAKEKTSMTVHGKVTESTKTAEKVFDILKNVVKAGEKDSQLPVIIGSKPIAKAGEKKLPGLKVPKLPSEKPQETPTETPAEVKPETKPEVKTQEVKPETKPEVKPETVAKTPIKQDVETQTPTSKPVIDTVGTAKPLTTPAVKTSTATKTATTAPEPVIPVIPPMTGGRLRMPIGAALKSIKQQDYYNILHHVPVKTQVHFAKKHRVHEEATDRKEIEFVPRKDSGDRKKLEYVGRPKTKQETLGRNAATKTQVIDEAKRLSSVVKKAVKEKVKAESGGLGDGKTKVFTNPPVVINPNLNRIDMNVAEGMANKVAGLAAGYGSIGAVGSASTAYEKAKKGDYLGAGKELAKGAAGALSDIVKEPYERYKKGDTVGAALSTASMLPYVGIPAAITDYARETGPRSADDKGVSMIPHKTTPGVDTQQSFERMKQMKPTTPPPLSSEPGIQLDKKPKIKPLSSVEPIKLK